MQRTGTGYSAANDRNEALHRKIKSINGQSGFVNKKQSKNSHDQTETDILH